MKCCSNSRRNVPNSLACLVAAASVFIFVPSGAQAQLTPWDDTNQVFVDFSVVTDSGVGRAPNSVFGVSLPSLGGQTIEPPRRMPISRLFLTQPPAKKIANKIALPKVKLIPPSKHQKYRASSRRKTELVKKQKSRAKPHVTSELSRKFKSSKPKAHGKFTPPPPAKLKPPARAAKTPIASKDLRPPAAPKIPPPPSNAKKNVKSLEARQSEAKPKENQQASLPTPARSSDPLNIMFTPGSSSLTTAARKNLDRIAAKLNSNESIRMQLMAYAGERKMSASKARRLSLSRALAVRSYLIKNGIRGTRIDVRALGNKIPSGLPNKVHLRVIGQ